jgi:outer membrane protein OmpA-like peptidoglycan-associated protein
MKFVFLAIFCLFLPNLAKTQQTSNPNARSEYIQKYKQTAIDEMERTGVLASVTMAQGILESYSGQSNLAINANNHFGVKCGGGWHGQTISILSDDHDRNGNSINSCYRKYPSAAQSFRDHSDVLCEPVRYGFLFQLETSDYRSWCNGIQNAGYATAKNYAQTLISIIQTHQLYEFDKEVQGPSRGRYINKINKSTFVLSKSGETLADLAHICRKNPEALIEFNDFEYKTSDKLPPNTRIFVQSKKKKWSGRKKFHTVQNNQTMFEISQLYGIKVKPLMARNKLVMGEEPNNGATIKLKGISFKKPPKPKTSEIPLVIIHKTFNFPTSLLFETGNTVIKPEATDSLVELVRFLIKNPTYRANIIGHTDNEGGIEANQLLSEKQAKAVYDFLILYTVPDFQVTYSGAGQSKPIGNNENEEGRALNRRVEVEIFE